ncbi:MAG: response regulator [Proteobacteria bacterium]|nr:response regulator [Pseudomonadota bacterium]
MAKSKQRTGLESATVLVADDDLEILSLIRQHLAQLGTHVLETSDGEEALELVAQQKPDLVLLDVMMPGRSGWEICKAIRESLDLGDIGVIMLTGIGANLNAMTSPLYGADAFLDKPFDLHALERTMRQVLASRRAGE